MSRQDQKVLARLHRFIPIALKRDNPEYYNLLKMVSVGEQLTTNYSVLHKIFTVLHHHSSKLDIDMHQNLVDMILSFDGHGPQYLVEIWCELLTGLTAVSANFIRPALHALASALLASHVVDYYTLEAEGMLTQDGSGEGAAQSGKGIQMQLAKDALVSSSDEPIGITQLESLVHGSFSRILRLVPMSSTTLSEVMMSVAPHHSSSLTLQFIWVKNVLRICEYCPGLRDSLLTGVLEKIISLDLHSSVQLSNAVDVFDHDYLALVDFYRQKRELHHGGAIDIHDASHGDDDDETDYPPNISELDQLFSTNSRLRSIDSLISILQQYLRLASLKGKDDDVARTTTTTSTYAMEVKSIDIKSDLYHSANALIAQDEKPDPLASSMATIDPQSISRTTSATSVTSTSSSIKDEVIDAIPLTFPSTTMSLSVHSTEATRDVTDSLDSDIPVLVQTASECLKHDQEISFPLEDFLDSAAKAERELSHEEQQLYKRRKSTLLTEQTTTQQVSKLSDYLFGSIFRCFNRSILPTQGCKFVQWLLFFHCSFRFEYCEVLFRLFFDRLESSRSSLTVRVNCVLFIASLVVRAKFVRLTSAADTLLVLAGYAHRYLEEHGNSMAPHLSAGRGHQSSGFDDTTVHNPSNHTIFYVVVESILYIITQRPDLLQDLHDRAITTRQNSLLQRNTHHYRKSLQFVQRQSYDGSRKGQIQRRSMIHSTNDTSGGDSGALSTANTPSFTANSPFLSSIDGSPAGSPHMSSMRMLSPLVSASVAKAIGRGVPPLIQLSTGEAIHHQLHPSATVGSGTPGTFQSIATASTSKNDPLRLDRLLWNNFRPLSLLSPKLVEKFALLFHRPYALAYTILAPYYFQLSDASKSLNHSNYHQYHGKSDLVLRKTPLQVPVDVYYHLHPQSPLLPYVRPTLLADSAIIEKIKSNPITSSSPRSASQNTASDSIFSKKKSAMDDESEDDDDSEDSSSDSKSEDDRGLFHDTMGDQAKKGVLKPLTNDEKDNSVDHQHRRELIAINLSLLTFPFDPLFPPSIKRYILPRYILSFHPYQQRYQQQQETRRHHNLSPVSIFSVQSHQHPTMSPALLHGLAESTPVYRSLRQQQQESRQSIAMTTITNRSKKKASLSFSTTSSVLSSIQHTQQCNVSPTTNASIFSQLSRRRVSKGGSATASPATTAVDPSPSMHLMKKIPEEKSSSSSDDDDDDDSDHETIAVVPITHTSDSEHPNSHIAGQYTKQRQRKDASPATGPGLLYSPFTSSRMTTTTTTATSETIVKTTQMAKSQTNQRRQRNRLDSDSDDEAAAIDHEESGPIDAPRQKRTRYQTDTADTQIVQLSSQMVFPSPDGNDNDDDDHHQTSTVISSKPFGLSTTPHGLTDASDSDDVNDENGLEPSLFTRIASQRKSPRSTHADFSSSSSSDDDDDQMNNHDTHDQDDDNDDDLFDDEPDESVDPLRGPSTLPSLGYQNYYKSPESSDHGNDDDDDDDDDLFDDEPAIALKSISKQISPQLTGSSGKRKSKLHFHGRH